MADEREEKEARIRRWRQAADECRAMAADTKGPQGRQNLLDLARASIGRKSPLIGLDARGILQSMRARSVTLIAFLRQRKGQGVPPHHRDKQPG